METYTLNDTLCLEVQLRDRSGIAYVAALFNRCTTGAHPGTGMILLVGDGQGQEGGDRSTDSSNLRSRPARRISL